MSPYASVIAYSQSFAEKFERVKSKIKKSAPQVVDIEHVGSTAIPGMQGKGVIDVLIGVNGWKEGESIVRSLESAGFFRGSANRGRVFLSLRKGMRDIHVHVVRKGTKQYNDFLIFRDYLKVHPEEWGDYVELKKIAYQLDGKGYQRLKGRYVSSILRKAKQEIT
jgi:GrpB-like predicted nucleotidyltransferase (UPF0157 family)